MLGPGETITSLSVAWVARVRDVPLWLLGRHRYLMAFTNHRLVVFERQRWRRRGQEPVLNERLEALALVRARRMIVLSQVLVVTAAGSRIVFEFRRRDRAVARSLAEALKPATTP